MVESCALRQDEILKDAAKLVRPGGTLGYATCTFAPEENEGTVLRFLNQHPSFEMQAVKHIQGFSPGRPDWLPPGITAVSGVKKDEVSHAVRLWPHKAPGEGHFIAILREKSQRLAFAPNPLPFQHAALSRDVRSYFYEFAVETLTWQPEPEHLSQHGSYLYLPPKEMPDLRGLRVVHWGLWLGVLKVKRFEPAHALAMALTQKDVHQVCDFSPGDMETPSYIRGEVFPVSGPDGWVMVTVDGYPLGWAKRVQHRLKSRSPRWLRGVG